MDVVLLRGKEAKRMNKEDKQMITENMKNAEGLKVSFLTLGCKVNQTESEALSQLLAGEGYKTVQEADSADMIIINTCTVTGKGSMKSRKLIRKMVKDHPGAIIAVMGCYAQLSPDEVAGIDGVGLIMGTQDRSSLLQFLRDIQDERAAGASAKKPAEPLRPLRKVKSFEESVKYEELPLIKSESRTRAMLKIQDGCSQFCTYCIVPYTRGPSRSRDPENVYREARELLKAGYKEIVLTGIHIGAFGRDFTDKNMNLGLLVSELVKLPGMKRLRLGSIEPMEFSLELLEVIAANAAVCPHFHIPLQSGSNKILGKMNRPYTIEDYAALLKQIRARVPDAAIASDIMVGFPGETDQDYQDGLRFIESCEFSGIHVFPYSRRPGTPAADMPEQIPNRIKTARVRELIQIGQKSRRKYERKFIGKQLEVLLENVDQDGRARGHTRNYLELRIPSSLAESDLITYAVREEDLVSVPGNAASREINEAE
ncbi:MiaB family protein [Dehalobacter sp. UNSWDHB]|jgi:MiaB-like tRNA modifying enzyme|uniref:tRNA (N(6)-L-threonylcarbamoyladenosine(37)-C(2))- methylthiotransferase MtaB n=1 Tax=unclassified Dehalobacter TaxID=2635733 RepID=UPI00028AC990|nr:MULTISPECIES: tRNA (N(6)-L-threonylcarbamoyladenosine(37)-C(2))-methylthiotransferase MtaB [unclassified Dehalobacter]AFV03579.1 MiaB family protein, possibly involved in tRNA or rRNA modification [Dehalobacter sp. DCA]AFV06564.1 MiaB family protein, possibly involved in tRNA or rRNA modification [Dehalobacter sp. CF]EQB20964.1 MiaB family protein [Dehalobacter sp. UNSWDHB]